MLNVENKGEQTYQEAVIEESSPVGGANVARIGWAASRTLNPRSGRSIRRRKHRG